MTLKYRWQCLGVAGLGLGLEAAEVIECASGRVVVRIGHSRDLAIRVERQGGGMTEGVCCPD